MIRVRFDLSDVSSGAARLNSILANVGKPGAITNIGAEFDKMSTASTRASSAVKSANDSLHATAGAAGHASGGILELIGHLGKMTLALAGIGFLTAGVHELAEAFIESADEATQITARLGTVTEGTADLAEAQKKVVDIANQTRQPMEAVAELYQKIGIAGHALGLTQDQIGLSTKTFAETLKISGNSAQQSKFAMMQLGEAMEQGRLQGIHFKAMMTDNAVFMRYLAQSMDVPMGKLRELGTEGKITAQQLEKALTDPKIIADIEKQFGRIPISFGDVRTAIANTLVQLAGDFSKGAGINTSLASLYTNIADFGASARPVFEKIGIAVRAAFEAIAPTVSSAVAAISPFFTYVINNAPELIRLVKQAAEAWLIYRGAVMAAALVTNLPAMLLGAATAIELTTTRVVELTTAIRTMGITSAIGTFFTELSAGVALFGEACLAAVPEIGAMAAALWATGIPEIILAITALVGAVVWFGESTFTIGGQVASGWDIIKASFAGAYAYVASVMGDIVDAVSGAWDSVTKFVNDHLGIITGLMVSIPALWPVAIYANWDAIVAWTKSTWESVSSFVSTHLHEIVDAIPILGPIINTISTYWDDIVKATDRIWANVVSVIKNHIYEILSAIPLIGGAVASAYAYANSSSGQKAAGAASNAFNQSLANSAAAAQEAKLNAIYGTFNASHPYDPYANVKPTAPVIPTFTPDGGGKKKGSGEDKAKRAKEFLQTLDGQVQAANLFGIEQQKISKELEYQKIVGRDLTTAEKTRIDTAVQDIANNKALTAIKQATFDLENKNTLLKQRALGMTDEQAAIEDAIDQKKLAALNAGVNISTAAFNLELGRYRTALLENQALEKRNALIKSATDTAKKYSPQFAAVMDVKDIDKQRADFDAEWSRGDLPNVTKAMHDAVIAGLDQARADAANKPWRVQMELVAGSSPTVKGVLDGQKATTDYAAQQKALDALLTAGKLDPKQYAQANKEISADYQRKMIAASRTVADQFLQDFSDGINELADLFGGKFGDILKSISKLADSLKANADGTSGLSRLATQISGSFGAGFQESNKNMLDISKGVKDLGKPLDNLKNAFDPQQGGSALKGIGSAVGGALAGYQMGSTIGGIGDMLGIKNFSTGAKIGGTIGGLTGNPIIAAGASVIGGIISSLFYKAPKGQATITGANSVALSGTSSALKSQASGMAGEVQSGLADVAAKLGADIGSFAVSIGTYKDMIRVNPTGGAVGGVKGSGAITYSSEADAVKAAIEFALKQGALTGLSDLASKAVKSLDIDSAVQFVSDWNSAMSDFASMTDPVTAAVKGITDPLKTLRDTMVKVGASTDDLTKLDQYRAQKLDAVLKQQLSSLNDFMSALSTNGLTKYDQLQADLAKFADYQTQIAGGATNIDQSAFTNLGQEILGLTNDVYGQATQQAQSIRDMLTQTTQGLQTNITTAFNTAAGGDASSAATDPTSAAIAAAEAARSADAAVTNDYLRQINDNLSALNAGSGSAFANYTDPGLDTLNGRMLKTGY